jgi:hypothetical protein
MSSLMKPVDAFLFLARCLTPVEQPDSRRDQLAAEIRAGRVSWERVIGIASEYWMTLALYRELGEKRLLDLLPDDLLEYFDAIHECNSARNREILDHSAELAGLLNQIGVEPLLLKGVSHLASGLYADPAVRFMSDIDILVPGDWALECWRLLGSAGYRPSLAFDSRVEDMPREEWPALMREGRVGELEMHRVDEWNHMLSSPSLYFETEPVALGTGKARILSATSRMTFTLAHAWVHHQASIHPAAPLRDLYDATQLLRRHENEISWPRVTDAFERAGRMADFRTACMMWRRLFSQAPPCAVDRPAWGWVYWQTCLLKVARPGYGLLRDQLTDHFRLLPIAFSRTKEGAKIRQELSSPPVLLGKLRRAARLCVGDSQGDRK